MKSRRTKILLIINGAKKLSKESLLAIELCQKSSSIDCSLIYTQKHRDAIKLAQHATDSGVECIIAVGGDGTCNEVINGIQKSINRESVILGIIPYGSGNDFHRMLGDFSVGKFIDSLTSQKATSIDLIEIESNNETVFSLNIAGVGFDGFVVNKLNHIRKNTFLKGKSAYVYSILRSFFSYKKPEVILSSLEYNFSGKMMMTAVCNGTTFGHGMIVSPKAKLNNGKLNVTVLGKVSLKDYLKNISRLKKGKLIEHPEVHYFETKELTISVKSEQMYLETDGEMVGNGDVRFKIVPKSLLILKPDY